MRAVIYLLLFLLCFSGIKAQLQVTGPDVILPGAPTVDYSYVGPHSISSWQCVDASGQAVSHVSVTPAPGNKGKVWATKLVSTCEFSVRVTFTDTSAVKYHPASIGLFTRSQAFIYPGESLRDTAHDRCNTMPCHNLCKYEWMVNGSNASGNGFFCNGTNCSFSNLLDCPSTSFPDYYAITCRQICGAGSCSRQSYPDTVFVALKNPVISGNPGISCVQASNYTYSCTQPTGATYYYWQLPAGWTITTGVTTSNITVTTNGTTGPVKVTAYKASGSRVKSNTVVFNTFCCVGNLTATANVSSGNTDNKEADLSIEATNTIGSGASATYHAGNVFLNTGFIAEPNCFFHAYSESCTGSFYRMSSGSSSDEDTADSNSDQIAFISHEDASGLPAAGQSQSTELSLSVFPNPNNGNFKIVFNSKVTGEISINNELGLSVYNQKIDQAAKLDLNISGLKQGIYILNVTAEGKNIKPVKLILQ